jgi:hypothetical protein
LKGERTVSKLAAKHGARPKVIHQWIEPLHWSKDNGEGRCWTARPTSSSGPAKKSPQVDQDTVRALHRTIAGNSRTTCVRGTEGTLWLTISFVQKAQALDWQARLGMIEKTSQPIGRCTMPPAVAFAFNDLL